MIAITTFEAISARGNLLISVGHVIVDSLSDRLGVTLSRSKEYDGFSGTVNVELNGSSFAITLFKPSTSESLVF